MTERPELLRVRQQFQPVLALLLERGPSTKRNAASLQNEDAAASVGGELAGYGCATGVKSDGDLNAGRYPLQTQISQECSQPRSRQRSEPEGL